MALVFTTFFIMGLGYLLVRRCLGRITGEKIAWVSFWIAAFGSGELLCKVICGQRVGTTQEEPMDEVRCEVGKEQSRERTDQNDFANNVNQKTSFKRNFPTCCSHLPRG